MYIYKRPVKLDVEYTYLFIWTLSKVSSVATAMRNSRLIIIIAHFAKALQALSMLTYSTYDAVIPQI